MPLKIVRNDITRMNNVEAIVNTANPKVAVGSGCDSAIYKAAGKEELLKYRRENIGLKNAGEVFITPGFNLHAKHIIHAVSPTFLAGKNESKLRLCYKNSLELAKENSINSIAFPLISSGSFGYPREQALAIAIDEINKFLIGNEMLVYLVVFDEGSSSLASRVSDIESYIDSHYVSDAIDEEYDEADEVKERLFSSDDSFPMPYTASYESDEDSRLEQRNFAPRSKPSMMHAEPLMSRQVVSSKMRSFDSTQNDSLDERLDHLSDSFSEYLLYLIKNSGMKNSEVYTRAGIDKKVFSKIKNNPDYHPSKMTAMCLCVGAKLNLDQTRDLLSRAGYALSPSDKTDVIFSYFIEKEIYDLIEIDITLEERGLPFLIA